MKTTPIYLVILFLISFLGLSAMDHVMPVHAQPIPQQDQASRLIHALEENTRAQEDNTRALREQTRQLQVQKRGF